MAFSVNKQSKINNLFNTKPIHNSIKLLQTATPILGQESGQEEEEAHVLDDESIDQDEDEDEELAQEYVYLNDNILSQKFGDFMDTNKQYNVKICIYKINNECTLPFLQFLFDKTGEKMTFSNINFQCPVITQHDLEEDQEHTFFMNQCTQELLKVLPIHDIFSVEILQKIYKGFIEYDNILYVVFDSTQIDNIIIDQQKYCWAIIDEIINARTILDKDVEQDIIDMFLHKAPFMMHILNNKGMSITQPIIAYLCNKPTPEVSYTTILELDNTNSINIIDEQIEHPFLGYYYYFTSKPITDVVAISKRYAIFTFDCRYILTDINNIQEKEKEDFIKNLEDNDTNLSIYFKEGGIQLWCIKTSEQFTNI
jgi:hypothetical protein